MADPYQALRLAHGLSQAGMAQDRPSFDLPGMLGQMPPQQRAMWEEMMRRQQLEALGQQAQPGIGMGAPQLAPYAGMLGQNPGLAQMLMRFGQ